MAVGRLRGELRQVTLQPTVLVHEVVIGLLRHTPKVDDKTHLHSLASRMMRQFLVDEARRRSAQQRGGDQFQVTFDAERLGEPDAASELVELEVAPSRLETIDEGKARVIELYYFSGLDYRELASELGMPTARSPDPMLLFPAAGARDRR